MTQNLLEKVRAYFSGETVSLASAAVGENEVAVGQALSRAIPLVLNSLMDLADRPGGNALLWRMTREAKEAGILSSPSRSVSTDGSWQQRGGELMRSLLEDQYSSNVETIARTCHLNSSAVGSLLGMAAPVTLGVLGQYTADNNLDAAGLGRWLRTQRNSVLGAVGLDIGSTAPWTRIKADDEQRPERQSVVIKPRPRSAAWRLTKAGRIGLLLLVLAVAALAGIEYFWSRSASATAGPRLASPGQLLVSSTASLSQPAPYAQNVPAPHHRPVLPTGRYTPRKPAAPAAAYGWSSGLYGEPAGSPTVNKSNELASATDRSGSSDAKAKAGRPTRHRVAFARHQSEATARIQHHSTGFFQKVGNGISGLFRGDKAQRRSRTKTAAKCPCAR